jgi:hypothetical protein
MAQKYDYFLFRKSIKNPHFADNITPVRRLSCPNTDNLHNNSQLFIVNPMPRRYYYYSGYVEDRIESVTTDSNKQKAFKMNNKFRHLAEIWETGWLKKKFSVVFVTMTIPESNLDIGTFLKRYKLYLSRKYQIEVLSYYWVLEFGVTGKNPHYHLAILTDRTKRLSCFCPEKIGLWNGFCKTVFVKKSVVRYMSKYYSKGDLMVMNRRRFGASNLSSNWFPYGWKCDIN